MGWRKRRNKKGGGEKDWGRRANRCWALEQTKAFIYKRLRSGNAQSELAQLNNEALNTLSGHWMGNN